VEKKIKLLGKELQAMVTAGVHVAGAPQLEPQGFRDRLLRGAEGTRTPDPLNSTVERWEPGDISMDLLKHAADLGRCRESGLLMATTVSLALAGSRAVSAQFGQQSVQ
jgi:hypothetical protein